MESGVSVYGACTQPKPNFADFTKFPTIHSQEMLNVESGGHPARHGSLVAGVTVVEKHRRSMSLDINHQFVSIQGLMVVLLLFTVA